jgi:hypothetical protein
MTRTFLSVGLAIVSLVAAPAWLPGQLEKSKPDPSLKDSITSKSSEKPKSEPLHRIGAFAGKVLNVQDEGKTFTLRVFGQTTQPKFTPGNPSSC